MPQSKQDKAIAIAVNANKSNVMHKDELYKRSETYLLGQMYLKNRKFTPYPNGRGGVEDSICKKHAGYSCKLMKNNELKYKLAVRAERKADQHKAEENEKLPQDKKTVDTIWQSWNHQKPLDESVRKSDPERYYSTINWWAFAKKNGLSKTSADAKMKLENGE